MSLYDNKLVEKLNIVADLVLISFFFLVGSIPVVTVGVSFVAACGAVARTVLQGRDSVLSSFLKTYRRCLIPGLLLSLAVCVSALVAAAPAWLSYPLLKEQTGFDVLLLSLALLALAAQIVVIRLLAWLGATDYPLKQCLAYALQQLVRNWFGSIVLLLVLIAAILLVVLYPPVLLIVPALVALLAVWLCCRKELELEEQWK